jgi:hypothetical protein
VTPPPAPPGDPNQQQLPLGQAPPPAPPGDPNQQQLPLGQAPPPAPPGDPNQQQLPLGQAPPPAPPGDPNQQQLPLGQAPPPAPDQQELPTDVTPEEAAQNVQAVMEQYNVDQQTAAAMLEAERQGWPIDKVLQTFVPNYQADAAPGVPA